jgi:hypothetical protein
MAKITRVAKAQQRYATKPVLDPATGLQKQTPVMLKNGEQKTTKRGSKVFLAVTERDLTRPLPPIECDFCHLPIPIGSPYKHVTPHGSSKRSRHQACPNWEIWELSSSWAARVAQVVDGLDLSSIESEDDVQSALESLAADIRALADESQEAADNVEQGFGTATMVSEAAAERADALNEWADEIEGVTIPDMPEPEEDDCDVCAGAGSIDDPKNDGEQIDCENCSGSGQFTPDEPTEDQIADWRGEVESEVDSVLGNNPV